jgi:hypothetical protein
MLVPDIVGARPVPAGPIVIGTQLTTSSGTIGLSSAVQPPPIMDFYCDKV